ncbi:HD domain-containing protein [Cellulomonas xylanilytica]|uniref:Metal-dependent phosphohydrolase, HD subdomain protein n=1 Tax=Cellulomonas xylanilytica TaxID=233583 RepID=A0A510V3C1_9CELL|nr:HD domain-containing protein [Cellulomonas xylanilytica]GEK21382.1 metal-dependent phosphohydrolase, HD subdomain protein [Cellulomonas xylanilytica]
MWSPENASKVASEYLSGLGRRWNHVRTVGELADGLAAAGKISADVAAAAWLHDLGYAEELSMTGLHALDGAAFLAAEGAPVEVVSLVAHHTGAEYEAEERGLRSLLSTMPAAEPSELDALTLLDLVTAPDGSLTEPETRIAEILSRYPDSSPVHRAVSRSRGELLASAERARRQLGLPDEWPAGALKGVLEP